ncbi:MAG: DUF5916 domain-containing protein [Gammaproteobacteria bacterium]|nr:DUF5916 domain-containing protein [Gammaproteobacteria bacterium]
MIRQSARSFVLVAACLLLHPPTSFGTTSTAEELSEPDIGLQTVTIAGHDGETLRALVVPREASDVEIVIDGVVEEGVWQKLPAHEEFYVTDPDTLERAPLRSQWRFFYTDRGFYIAAKCDQDTERLVERLSARDLGFLNRDYVSFTLDTSGEARYGYWFQLNLGGSRSDGTIQPERQFSDSWDGAWYGETARTPRGWSAEFFIPWSIMSMPQVEGDRQMGIVMQRNVAYRNERYGYPPLPFTKPKFLSGFRKLALGEIDPHQQLSFFPQVSSTYNAMADSTEGQAGLDVFWRPSPNIQVTATANPDFGTVEADSVIINLSAIETFFPEKRLFFLEGQEIFNPTGGGGGWSGGSSARLLHTRRIGQRPIRPELPGDTDFDYEQFRKPSDLLGAAKATGQVGSLRYGVLTAIEDDTTFYGVRDEERVAVHQSGRDFGVVRALWENSNGDYKGLGFMSTRLEHPTIQASTHSFDGSYFSDSGKVRLKSLFFVSDIEDEDSGYGGSFELDYAPRQGVTHQLEYESFDDEINLNYMGYLPRNDIDKVDYQFRMRKTTERFKERDTEFRIERAFNGAGQVIDASMRFEQDFTFKNNTRFRVRARHNPGSYDDRNSFGNGTFYEGSRTGLEMRYSSNSARRFYYSLSSEYRTEALGGANVQSGSFLIWRPSDRMTMHASIFYSNRDSWLLFRGDRRFTAFASESWAPRFGTDLFITAKQHLRMDLEWRAIKAHENTFYQLPVDDTRLVEVADPSPATLDDFAISRLNMQIRYRWELAPMSDLFIVYSKNSELPGAIQYGFAEQFSRTFDHPFSEGLVVKLRHHLGT